MDLFAGSYNIRWIENQDIYFVGNFVLYAINLLQAINNIIIVTWTYKITIVNFNGYTIFFTGFLCCFYSNWVYVCGPSWNT